MVEDGKEGGSSSLEDGNLISMEGVVSQEEANRIVLGLIDRPEIKQLIQIGQYFHIKVVSSEALKEMYGAYNAMNIHGESADEVIGKLMDRSERGDKIATEVARAFYKGVVFQVNGQNMLVTDRDNSDPITFFGGLDRHNHQIN